MKYFDISTDIEIVQDFPYHSLDPAQAIERILESKDIGEEDMTRKGVEILRRIMAQKNQEQ